MERDGKSNYQCQEVIWGHHHRAKQEAPQLSPKVSPTERTKQKTKEPYVSIRIREYEYTYRRLGVGGYLNFDDTRGGSVFASFYIVVEDLRRRLYLWPRHPHNSHASATERRRAEGKFGRWERIVEERKTLNPSTPL